MKFAAQRPLRCGIILAGGEGKRVQPFIRRFLGIDLPKQYVNIIGTRSMLEHTFERAERLIPPERLFVIVARDHFDYPDARRQVSNRPPHTVILQPQNKETGPGLLLPLMHLLKYFPDSIVGVFPSDHFVLQEEHFTACVRRAYEAVEKCPEKVVFLGVKATDPEEEYGYIVPEYDDQAPGLPILGVKAFVEKPESTMAAQIMSLGGLWNTMIMVFKPETLLHLVRQSSPELYLFFQQIFKSLDTSRELSTVEKAYKQMKSLNLSKDLLEGLDLHSRNQLSVAPMEGVFWSDWGSKDRILSVLGSLGYLDRLFKGFSLQVARDQLRTAANPPTGMQVSASRQ